MSRHRVRAAVASLLSTLAACGGSSGGGDALPAIVPGTVDVTVDRAAIAATLQLSDETFAADACAVEEGATQPGLRRLLRFDTLVVNHGAQPVTLGPPTSPLPPLVAADFEYAPCHQHHHFEGWAEYRLETLAGDVVAVGHKQAFCLLDTVMVVPSSPSLDFASPPDLGSSSDMSPADM